MAIYTEMLIFSLNGLSFWLMEYLARPYAADVWQRIFLAGVGRRKGYAGQSTNSAPSRVEAIGQLGEITYEMQWVEELRATRPQIERTRKNNLNKWLESVFCPFSVRLVPALAPL